VTAAIGAWLVTAVVVGYAALVAAAFGLTLARRVAPRRKALASAVSMAADALKREHGEGAYDEAARRASADPGEGADPGFAEAVRLEIARREGLQVGVDAGTRMHYRLPRSDPPAEPSRFRRRLHPLLRFWRDVTTPADARWFADFEPGRGEDPLRESAWRQVRAYVGDGPREPQAPPVVTLLTRRQIDCLTWAARGKSSTDIASILGLSSHTVDEHLGEACKRLGVRTRVQAVMEASSRGLIPPERATPQD
jgi:DNA-binding CsgD family transcriptional regulator